MFTPSLPWWEFVLRAGIVYVILLVLVRVSGKRTVGQFTPFDLIVVLLLSETVGNALSGGDNSILGGLLGAATLLALSMLAGFLTSRSRTADKLLEGEAVLLGRDGRIFESVLRKQRVSMGEMERALREADCNLSDMKLAMLEADGNISVTKEATG